MIYAIDIDGTICTPSEGDYINSRPLKERIKKINSLYDEGHKIIYFTARGMGRSNNNRDAAYAVFYNFTFNQLKEWGVKFHELRLGKMEADYFIDDKGVIAYDYFRKYDTI